MKKVAKKIISILVISLLAYVLPQLILIAISNKDVYVPEEVPKKDYGIVLGARVYNGGKLSPIAQQRAEGAVFAYQQGIVNKIFVSGASGFEVNSISDYLVSKGVPETEIVKDSLGIDTNDTCRHFADVAREAVLFTQQFHLPRAMHMCRQKGVQTVGMQVNRLAISESGDLNKFETYSIRTKRFLKESGLTWTYVLGIYDAISDEAENRE